MAFSARKMSNVGHGVVRADIFPAERRHCCVRLGTSALRKAPPHHIWFWFEVSTDVLPGEEAHAGSGEHKVMYFHSENHRWHFTACTFVLAALMFSSDEVPPGRLGAQGPASTTSRATAHSFCSRQSKEAELHSEC